MRFTDPDVLLGFLPPLLAGYFLVVSLAGRRTPGGDRDAAAGNWVLAAGSLYLLVGGAGWLGAVLGVAALLTHAAVRGIDRARRRGHPGVIPEAWCTVAVTGHLLLLGGCRYAYPVLDDTVAASGSWTAVVPRLFAPFALVFVTGHAISLVVDVYRGETGAPRSAVDTTLHLTLFPFMAAGPLVRHRDVAAQLDRRTVGMAAFSFGVRRFAVGLGKTLLIADVLAGPATEVFTRAPATLGPVDAWLGAVCFGLQIYYALSGYADMALGLGRVLGFRLPENFNRPYAAQTLHDFWRRWYISLTTWLRTYAALPLGGMADRSVRAGGTLVVLFLAIGLWHGAEWSILRWAGLHALVLGVERLGLGAWLSRRPRALRHLYVVVVVLVGWVVLRVETLPRTLGFLGVMVGVGAGPLTLTPSTVQLDLAAGAALVVGLVGAVPLVSSLGRWVVTVDAVATSGLMLVATAVLFVGRVVRTLTRAVLALTRAAARR